MIGIAAEYNRLRLVLVNLLVDKLLLNLTMPKEKNPSSGTVAQARVGG